MRHHFRQTLRKKRAFWASISAPAAPVRPKLFGRVQRFQCAIALARRHLTVDSAELAIACGYFDQSHLMRDFVAFSGVSPADYKRRQTKFDRAGIHVKRHHLPLFE
jgi:AraC-like DNA-binding protein